MIVLHFGPPLATVRRTLAGLSAVLVLLFASVPSSAEVADWDKVVAAAKAEGGSFSIPRC